MIREWGRPGDLGWVVQAHGELYAREQGWVTGMEAYVCRIMADFGAAHDQGRENLWIAELDGGRAGCVMCVSDAEDPETAVLRVLLVDPAARGHGLGGALVDACIEFARKAGYRRMRLWTSSNLDAALSLYRARGFRLIAEAPHTTFGPELTGQTYQLNLP